MPRLAKTKLGQRHCFAQRSHGCKNCRIYEVALCLAGRKSVGLCPRQRRGKSICQWQPSNGSSDR